MAKDRIFFFSELHALTYPEQKLEVWEFDGQKHVVSFSAEATYLESLHEDWADLEVCFQVPLDYYGFLWIKHGGKDNRLRYDGKIENNVK